VLLVPSSVLTVGVSEIANGALEAGVPRLSYALVRFALLGAGMAAAFKSWALFHALPFAHEADEVAGLPKLVVLAILGVGATALTVVLQVRWRDFAWVLGGVWLAYGSKELAEVLLAGHHTAPLVSALLVGAGAQLQHRFTGRSPAIVIVPGLLQLTPGYLGTTALLRMLAGTPKAGDNFGHVMLLAVQLTIGFLLANVLFRSRARARPHRARFR
jgi:uncharacterized membrane protein YjjB (DUF3815 family)